MALGFLLKAWVRHQDPLTGRTRRGQVTTQVTPLKPVYQRIQFFGVYTLAMVSRLPEQLPLFIERFGAK